jgi:carbon storage regulator
MLVLSRTRDETIMIGDDVEITIVDIRGDKVRLGINAPAHVPVHRKEVYDAIKRENAQAAKINPGEITDVVANAKRPKGPNARPPQNREARKPKTDRNTNNQGRNNHDERKEETP